KIHLRQRRRRHRLPKRLENLLRIPSQFLPRHFLHFGQRIQTYFILQLPEFQHQRLRNHVRTRAQNLTELHKSRPQVLTRQPKPLPSAPVFFRPRNDPLHQRRSIVQILQQIAEPVPRQNGCDFLGPDSVMVEVERIQHGRSESTRRRPDAMQKRPPAFPNPAGARFPIKPRAADSRTAAAFPDSPFPAVSPPFPPESDSNSARPPSPPTNSPEVPASGIRSPSPSSPSRTSAENCSRSPPSSAQTPPSRPARSSPPSARLPPASTSPAPPTREASS